jgi:malonate transporter
VTAAVAIKLLAVLVTAAIGYLAGRMKWLVAGASGSDAARVLSNAAFHVFIPALLFRTTARLDFATMPWRTIAAFFVPVIGVMLAVYVWQRLRGPASPAVPTARAISVSFGNTVQLGIPFWRPRCSARPGLAIHIPLISLHALLLLTVLTVLVELDLARSAGREGAPSSLRRTLAVTLRNTVIHPVVLPVLAGPGLEPGRPGPLPGLLDEIAVRARLGGGAVCLVLIGVSLASTGRQGPPGAAPPSSSRAQAAGAAGLVLAIAHWGFGLGGLPLAVVVMLAALPVGSNALIFAQRYARWRPRPRRHRHQHRGLRRHGALVAGGAGAAVAQRCSSAPAATARSPPAARRRRLTRRCQARRSAAQVADHRASTSHHSAEDQHAGDHCPRRGLRGASGDGAEDGQEREDGGRVRQRQHEGHGEQLQQGAGVRLGARRRGRRLARDAPGHPQQHHGADDVNGVLRSTSQAISTVMPKAPTAPFGHRRAQPGGQPGGRAELQRALDAGTPIWPTGAAIDRPISIDWPNSTKAGSMAGFSVRFARRRDLGQSRHQPERHPRLHGPRGRGRARRAPPMAAASTAAKDNALRPWPAACAKPVPALAPPMRRTSPPPRRPPASPRRWSTA